MTLDRYPDLDPAEGEVVDAEVLVTEDVLVKAFALGPNARLSPHEHHKSVNVFHVVEGTVTVLQDGTEERIAAPGVVFHDRGVEHGARNDGEEIAVFTASLAPMPG